MGYLNATRPAYACSQSFDPSPSPDWVAPSTAPAGSPLASGATPAPAVTPPAPGFVQPDMGHLHEPNVGATVRYTYCPPASGKHYNAASTGDGPIPGGLYGPEDRAVPPGWVHNLEHGGIVLLYKCPGPSCTEEGQQALEELLAKWPESPICKYEPGKLTPVIARFDDMSSNYTAIVWDVVLPMAQIDENLLFEFYARQGELYNPEKAACQNPTPAPTPTPAATASPTVAPSTGPTTAPTAAPSGSAVPVSPAATAAPSPS